MNITPSLEKKYEDTDHEITEKDFTYKIDRHRDHSTIIRTVEMQAG